MRLLHTADWHIGQELQGHDRRTEHEAALQWVIDLVVDRQVDALLVAGDVYHSPNPSVAAQALFFQSLAELRRRRPSLDIVCLGGNHDGASRLELPTPLLDDPRVTLLGALPSGAEAAPIIPLHGPDGVVGAALGASPYLRPGDLKYGTSLGVDSEKEQDALRAHYGKTVDAARAAHPGAPIVLTGHLNVQGGAMSELSERRIVVGGEEATPVEIFPRAATYVALGHLHRPQTLSDDPMIRYSGSLFPLSTAERRYRHSVSLVDLIPGCAPALEVVEIPRPAPFLRVPDEGASSLAEVEAALAALSDRAAPPPYLEICVRLDGPTPDLRARIDAALAGKDVRLTRIRRADRAGAAITSEATVDLRARDPRSLFEEFHRREYAAPPSDELAAAFDALLRETEAELGRAPGAEPER